MKVKLPFSPRMEDAYFCYLIDTYGYSVPDSLKIIDYIKLHFSDFVVFRLFRKVGRSRIVIWNTFYHDSIVPADKLLKFIENDCLPF